MALLWSQNHGLFMSINAIRIARPKLRSEPIDRLVHISLVSERGKISALWGGIEVVASLQAYRVPTPLGGAPRGAQFDSTPGTQPHINATL